MQGAASPGRSERCRAGDLLLARLGQEEEEEEEGGGLVLRGVAKHRAAAPAPQPCQRPALGDGQRGLVGFVLLTRGVHHVQASPPCRSHDTTTHGFARGIR